MELNKLKKQVTDSKRRVGRGISAGQGKTAGRGTKGQNSRTGGPTRPGFEGGQMPLVQRVPKKRGFRSRNEKPQTVNVLKLASFPDGSKVNVDSLKKAGIIAGNVTHVKIVGEKAELKKLTVNVPISKTAAALVEKAGGKIEKVKK